MSRFSHLHVHTQYSLLDGAASIDALYKKAVKDNMPGLAITDHGNMFGVFQFVAQANKHKNEDGSLKVKPIIGCEFYITENRHRKTFSKPALRPSQAANMVTRLRPVFLNCDRPLPITLPVRAASRWMPMTSWSAPVRSRSLATPSSR